MKAQRGVTLISTLVGLLISMGVILCLLLLFKSVIAVSVTADQDAQQDGELSTGLETLQRRIQGAGFGLSATSTPHVVVGPTNLSSAPVAVLWRQLEGTAVTCNGAQEFADTDSVTGQPMRVIRYLTANGCNDTAALGGLTWTRVADLMQFKNTLIAQSSFSLSSKPCAPFGVGVDASTSHYFVDIYAPSSANRAGVSGVGNTHYGVCLSNLTPVKVTP